MPIYDIYSKRDKPLPDVYTYNLISDGFRNQVIHLWRRYTDQFKEYYGSSPKEDFFKIVCDIIAEEHELDELPSYIVGRGLYAKRIEEYLRGLSATDTDKILDVIEITFRLIESHANKGFTGMIYSANDVINDLNYRFRQKGLGYEFSNSRILRIDSKLLHAEAVQPALLLLSNQNFASANKEYLSAHEHFRHSRYEESINECLKTFESTMKIICGLRSWPYDKDKATASVLLKICFDNELLPSYLSTHFSGVRATLEAGIPTTRNRTSGHGGGEEKKEVPEYLASYILHLTAVSIKLLVEAHQAKP